MIDFTTWSDFFYLEVRLDWTDFWGNWEKIYIHKLHITHSQYLRENRQIWCGKAHKQPRGESSPAEHRCGWGCPALPHHMPPPRYLAKTWRRTNPSSAGGEKHKRREDTQECENRCQVTLISHRQARFSPFSWRWWFWAPKSGWWWRWTWDEGRRPQNLCRGWLYQHKTATRSAWERRSRQFSI